MRGKKGKTIKSSRKEAVFKESQAIVLLEDMRDSIKLIAETQSATIKELREFKMETRDNFKAVFKYQSRFSDEVYERFDRLDDELAEIKKELKKIDKSKISAEKFNLLEKRVIKLERKLEKYKISAKIRV